MDAATLGALSAKVNAVTNRGVRQATAGSYTFTAPVTGWHRVRLQGGGGGGSSVGGGKRGGSAGMFVEMLHYLTTGVSYTYVVGAAGAIGGAGGNSTFTGPHVTQTAYGGNANLITITGRLDGNTTDGAPAVDQTGGAIGGAHGNLTNANGGYCGCFAGGVGNASGGGGGASRYAAGGDGGVTGTAGTFGSGGGGGMTGGAGGAGVFEIEFLGAN